jgi:plasmid stabilization system protein ParE
VKIEILDAAESDLAEGFHFYERQHVGLGWYFLDSLFSDIDSLLLFAGVHQLAFGYYRCLAKRFPFAVYYSIVGNTIQVLAVLDCRRHPSWIRERLTKLS